MVITAAASTGFMVMEEETDSLNLWQPTDSNYVKNIKWLQANFPSKTRVSSVLILSDNVLESFEVRHNRPLRRRWERDFFRVLDGEGAAKIEHMQIEG